MGYLVEMLYLEQSTRYIPYEQAMDFLFDTYAAAVRPSVAGAMTFVDRDNEPRLERILSEIRTHARQTART